MSDDRGAQVGKGVNFLEVTRPEDWRNLQFRKVELFVPGNEAISGAYSYLNATVGSIVVARRAGTSAASNATNVNKRLMAT